MANIKSQIKRNRQNEKRRERNRRVRSSVRTASKKLLKAVESNQSPDTIRQLYLSFVKTIDKAAGAGIIHWKTSARKKSRITRRVNAALNPPA